MKKKDLGLILVVGFVSAIASVLVCNAIFGSPKQREQQVEVVQPIASTFPETDSRYFNNQSIDPTRLITIGQNANPDPFSGNPE